MHANNWRGRTLVHAMGIFTFTLVVNVPEARAENNWWPFGQKKAETPIPSPPPPPPRARKLVRETVRENLLVSFGTGLPVISGDLGWGFDSTIVARVSEMHPIYLGLDLGYYHLSEAYLYEDITLDVVRLAATGLYRQPVSQSTFFYLGLSLGPAFASPSYDLLKLNGSTRLAFHLRPGVEFAISDLVSISTEIRMGTAPDLSINLDRFGNALRAASIVGSGFLLYPQVNAVFRF